MDQETREILFNCSISTRMTAKTFFPERFTLPFSKAIHDPILEMVDDSNQQTAIAAPRGYGKTSIVALAKMAKAIMFRQVGFIVYINKSETAAIMQTENLRRELVTNPAIKHFFGSFKIRSADTEDFDEQFSKKSWVAYDTMVLPRGAGQQVRGILYKNDRPGLIIIDDLEDPEKINNDEIRKGWYEWLYADVLKSVPRIGPKKYLWKIIYIDTLKHEDSVLQKLLNAPDWNSIRLEACDDNFKSTAPEFISDAEIKKEWEHHVEAGQTDVFFRELRNLPISTKDSAFRTEYFKYYNIPDQATIVEGRDIKLTEPEVQHSKTMETVVILDPAKTVKIHSAESAIVGVGIDLTSARLCIRDIVSEKMYPDEIYDTLFGMGTRLGAKVLGVEETSLNEFIKQPIKNEMFRRGTFFELVWLKARGGMSKEMRVRELVPYYRGGYIYHNASCATIRKLEQQLLMFPRSALWDIMDCLAYIVEMLELGERYFCPQQDPDDSEAEFAELDYEPSVENWRIA